MGDDSGSLELNGEVISYRSSAYGQWQLRLSEVRVIGEATNQNGPFLDDYFICFATGPGGWYEASFYATGRDAFLSALCERLGASMEMGLCHSTDFASRVLWPPALAGKPMFTYTDVEPRTWIGRLFGSLKNTQTYTDEVAEFLRG